MEQSQIYIDAFEKTKKHNLDAICKNNIISITCGDEFVVMLLTDNSIIISPCPSFLETSFIPEQIDKNVVSISCGVSHISALLSNSNVVVWSKTNEHSSLNDDMNLYPVKDIACGDFMTMILYKNNVVKHF